MQNESARTFESPAFVVGKERSGTTLLSAILNRHPDVCVTPETDFMYQLSIYPGGYEQFEADWPESMFRMVDRMKPTADWSKPGKQLLERLKVEHLNGRDTFIELGEMICEHYNKKLWIEKTPNHIHCLPFIRKLFPNAPIIHIIRDGRDVAYSLTQVKFGNPNLYKNILDWSSAVSSARAFQTSDALIITVHYEELITNPEDTVRSICRFLGIDFASQMLSPDGTEKAILDLTGTHMAQAASQIDKTKISAWLKNLSKTQVSVAEMLAHDELTYWKYKLSSAPNHPPLHAEIQTGIVTTKHDRTVYNEVLETIANSGQTVIAHIKPNPLEALPKKMPDIIIINSGSLLSFLYTHKHSLILTALRLLKIALRIIINRTSLIYIINDNDKSWTLMRFAQRFISRISSLTIIIDNSNTPLKSDLPQINQSPRTISSDNPGLSKIILMTTRLGRNA